MDSQYERLLREIRDTYFLIQDEKIEFLSNSDLASLGYGESELEGKPFTYTFPPELHGNLLKVYRSLITGEKNADRFRTSLQSVDGRQIPIEISAWSTQYQNQPAIAGIVMDLTERQETEKVLRESEEKLRVMLESIAEGVQVIDLESRILDINNVMLRLHGYDRKEDIIGRSCFEFIPYKEQAEALEHMNRNLQDGVDRSIELTLEDKDGNQYEAEISAAPLKDKAGNPIGFISVTKDITERKRAQEALQYRILFEELIATTSTSFINYAPEEIDEGITNALKTIAEFSGADRSHVCLFGEGGKQLVKVYEWCSEGIESQIDNLQGLTEDACPWWIAKLRNYEIIQVSSDTDLPPQALDERERMGLAWVRSSLTVPMNHGGTLIGILGFHCLHTERVWSDDDIALLKIVGETFSNALTRKQAEEALREAEELNRTLVETASKAGEGLAVFQNQEDENAICIFANDEFSRIVGYAVDDLLGKPSPETIPKSIHYFRSNETETEDDDFSTRTRMELDLHRPDGEIIPVDIGVVSTTYQGIPATVAYVTDITERKKQEAENLQLQETLRFYSNQVVKASKELVHAIRGVHARESTTQSESPGFLKRAAPALEPLQKDDIALLTAREIQVLQLAAKGMTNKDISVELGIAVRTVKGHLINIFAKLKVKSRTEAVSCALKEGWITLEDMGQGFG